MEFKLIKSKHLIAYLFGYLFIWVGLTALFYNKFAVVGATTENIAWSNHLSIMYDKHPGLGALVIKAFSLVSFGNATLAAGLSSGVCVLVALVFTYKICKLYFSYQESVLLTILTTASAFYLFRYFLSFDQNIVLLPFWVIASYYFALMQKTPSYKNIILLSIAVAVGVYAKFEIFLLAGVIFLYIICTFKKEYLSKIIIAAVIFLVCMIPAIIGLIHTDFSPIFWAFKSGKGAAATVSQSGIIAKFFLAQLYNILPILYAFISLLILFIYIAIKRLKIEKDKLLSNLKHPLVAIWLYPFVIFAILQTYSGQLPGGWALVLMALFLPAIYKLFNIKIIRPINVKKLVLIMITLQLIAFTAYNCAKYFNNVVLSDNNGNSIAIKADSFWAEYYNTPINYVLDKVTGTNLAAFSQSKPLFLRDYSDIANIPKGSKVLLALAGCNSYNNIKAQGFKILHYKCTSITTVNKYNNIKTDISLFVIANS